MCGRCDNLPERAPPYVRARSHTYAHSNAGGGAFFGKLPHIPHKYFAGVADTPSDLRRDILGGMSEEHITQYSRVNITGPAYYTQLTPLAVARGVSC